MIRLSITSFDIASFEMKKNQAPKTNTIDICAAVIVKIIYNSIQLTSAWH